jgi:chromatin structure-remodeling complex subunit RSC3/30
LRQELPDFLHWRPEGGQAAVSRVEELLLFEIHVDFLYNDFLLYRTLGQRTQTQPQEIIGISREILKALIMMVSKRARYGESITNTGWAVRIMNLSSKTNIEFSDISKHYQLCLPGLPAAGVLSAELLRRSRSPVAGASPSFPRSEVIQNLTIFASYLDTLLKPDEGNYRVAQQGQKAIHHVLDLVLSGEQLSSAVTDNSEGYQRPMNEASLLDGVNTDDHDMFLSWFDGSMQQMSDSWLTWVNLT